jgi:hypothetical protein
VVVAVAVAVGTWKLGPVWSYSMFSVKTSISPAWTRNLILSSQLHIYTLI